MPMLRFLPGSTAGTRRNLQHRRSHAEALRVCSCRSLWRETWQTLALPRNPRDHTASLSGSADILTSAAVPGRSAALDVWPASSIVAEACGDAAQVAFDRKLSLDRNEIGELRQQNIHYRLLMWAADGRPHPGRHSNASVRGRHRLQSKRAASVGEIPS